ncbi:MAG: hypothetical protein UW76_C0015G0017 [Parcubacteria group bacterium GW2011_GWF2_44_8b]|nr:MAG: hypothetical protein UW76_C0015G0017 [Parcubacteria group bacterium GW2011_GWF2_44_8b]
MWSRVNDKDPVTLFPLSPYHHIEGVALKVAVMRGEAPLLRPDEPVHTTPRVVRARVQMGQREAVDPLEVDTPAIPRLHAGRTEGLLPMRGRSELRVPFAPYGAKVFNHFAACEVLALELLAKSLAHNWPEKTDLV